MSKKKTGEKSVVVNLVANGIKTLMSVLFPLITFPYASRILEQKESEKLIMQALLFLIFR